VQFCFLGLKAQNALNRIKPLHKPRLESSSSRPHAVRCRRPPPRCCGVLIASMHLAPVGWVVTWLVGRRRARRIARRRNVGVSGAQAGERAGLVSGRADARRGRDGAGCARARPPPPPRHGNPPPPPGGRRCLHARAAGEVECGARSNFVGVEKYSSGNFLTAELEMTAAAGRSRARACTDSIDGMPRQLLEFFAWGESH
jgi:hypothetical protein